MHTIAQGRPMTPVMNAELTADYLVMGRWWKADSGDHEHQANDPAGTGRSYREV